MALDSQTALEALKKVMDPELRRDIVSLGMVKNLRVSCCEVEISASFPSIS